jgi:trigger factor
MEIVRENIDELNAIIKVKIAKEDYNESYEKALKNVRKEVQMPGFRAGQVPASVVKKKYGVSILGEELDKVLNSALFDYIKENELDVLGQPVPKTDDNKTIDWKNPSDFEFSYEIGLAPSFEVKLTKKEKYTYNKVKVDAELIDKQVNDFAKRNGTLVVVDKSEDNDMIMASFKELDDKDKVVEGGFVHSSTVAIEFTEDKKAKKKLIGLKAGDSFIIDPRTISRGAADLAAMLNISKEAAEKFDKNVELTVTEVKRLEATNVDQELIDKIYGAGVVEGVEAFRAKIEEEMSSMFNADSDRLFKRDFANKLVEKLELSLPDEFLKKWIAMSNNEVTPEQIEAEYDQYSESLKWQLIENKIIKDNDLQVSNDEAVDYTKDLLGKQYAQYGMMIPEEEEFNKMAMSVLGNKDEGKKIYDALYETKVMGYLKDAVKVEEKELSYDEFVKVASEK